jgi:hypothetical protein
MTTMKAVLSVTVLAAVFAPLYGQAEPKRGSGNAALQYWQAFALLPDLKEEQQKLLTDRPLGKEARQIADQSRKAMLYLQRGAAHKSCDWGLDYNDGVELAMPHVVRARNLARVACLRGRIAFAEHNAPAALDGVLPVFTLGRHVGGTSILISMLVDYAIENVAIDTLAPELPHLDHASLDRITKALASLPPAATLDQAMVTEKEFFLNWSIRWAKKESQQDPKGFPAKLAGLIGSPDKDEVLKLIEGGRAQPFIDGLEAAGPAYDELRQLSLLPRAQFLARWPERQKELGANAVVRMMLPAIAKCIDARDRYRARMALLQAALAVVRDGQDALTKYPDPFGAGPFEYVAAPNGFELRSRLVLDQKAVTVRAGKGD